MNLLADTDLFVELIDWKLERLTLLRSLGERQLALIEADDMEGLLLLLAEKQTMLNDLQEIESRLDPFRGQNPEQRTWRMPQDRVRCAAAADCCRNLLREIIRLEATCESLLVQRRDQAAAQLQIAHTAGRVSGAYHQQTFSSEERFLDLSSEI